MAPLASRAVARILIVGGGCRGRQLARRAGGRGPRGAGHHPHRGRARGDRGDRRGVLDRHARSPGDAAGGARRRDDRLLAARHGPGSARAAVALHASRLEFFLGQMIDTTVRGFVYEAPDASGPAAEDAGEARDAQRAPAALIAGGERIVRAAASRNSIPLAFRARRPAQFERVAGGRARRRRCAARRHMTGVGTRRRGERADARGSAIPGLISQKPIRITEPRSRITDSGGSPCPTTQTTCSWSQSGSNST